MNGVHKDPPIAAFEAEIAMYLAIQTEIMELPGSATIGYLRVDSQPMKQALSSTVTKWIYSFTLYIQGIVSFIDILLELASCPISRVQTKPRLQDQSFQTSLYNNSPLSLCVFVLLVVGKGWCRTIV